MLCRRLHCSVACVLRSCPAVVLRAPLARGGVAAAGPRSGGVLTSVANGNLQQRVLSQQVPYTDGVYENPDGSPVDITEALAYGKTQAGGGSRAYSSGWDRVFGSRHTSSNPESDAADGPKKDTTSPDAMTPPKA